MSWALCSLMKMNKEEFIKLMEFPKEWEEMDMYPDELAVAQINEYQPGHEEASEHDRCGAFHWWFKQDPTEEQLEKLMRLASLDPDSHLGYDMRDYIRKAKNFTTRVEAAW